MALSDYLAPALQIGSTVLSAGSQLARGAAAQAIGARRKAAADFEAEQLEQEAQTSQGIGMVNAANQQRQTSLVTSMALARAAASGAGASDPTVMKIISQTAGEGAYRQALAMYEGEAQARLDRLRAATLQYQAGTDVSDAAVASRQADQNAVSTVLSGAGKALSMAERFWEGPG